jgi:hypothetical protein
VSDQTIPITNGEALLEDDEDELLEAGEPDIDEPEPLPDDAAIDELFTDDFGADDVGEQPRLAAFEPPADDALAERLARLEQATQALVAAQTDRDGRRVHRKVSAASIGAFVAAAIPVLLDLVGALNLSPEVTSTISAGAALVGAFAAGWATPERRPSIPPEILRP